MALLSLQRVSLAYGGPELLDGVTLQIEPGERVCLVGRNGAGKSTLMRVISGEVQPDAGEIIRPQAVRISSLPQDVPQDLSGTVFEVVSQGLGSLVEILSEYRTLGRRLAHEHDPAVLAALERIQHEIESSGGWQVQQKVETVLSQLRLNADAQVSELSGGFKRRVLLARALVNEPDLLLLDEPTNHLDIDSICWLEDFLGDFRGAILFITHDRRFLQALATRILELDRGRVKDWPGDYATYLSRKQAELEVESTHNALFDKKLSQEEAWIRQGIKARRTRNEGRVRALKALREERRARREQIGSATLRVNEAERSGRLVIEAEGVAYSYGDVPVIRDFSTIIMRGDKIGVIGPNGSGKTTLLRLLLGSLAPRQGSVRLGTRLEVAYFDQHRAILDFEASVVDNVGEGDQQVTVNGRTRHIIGYLEDFLFSPERARLPVKVLSGGERNRALLAKLFTKPSNVLVMDEPTNDLDTDTLELLEDLLVEYDGTVLLVSHDRAFLDNVVTSTIVFEGKGRVVEYVGGYDDWLRQRKPEVPLPKAQTQKSPKARPKQDRPRSLTFKERAELEGLPGRIESLEAERDTIYGRLADPGLYRQEGDKIPAMKSRIETLEGEIRAAYERWEFLEAIKQSSS